MHTSNDEKPTVTGPIWNSSFAHVVRDLAHTLSGAGATLTVALYVYAKEQGEFDAAFAIAAILMLLTLTINLAAEGCTSYLRNR